MAEIIQLPRGKADRPALERLGLYLRVGFNQHLEVLEAVGSGERELHGLVIDARWITRHKELVKRALANGLDVVLDPRTVNMALPGGWPEKHSDLPWGSEGIQVAQDYTGKVGRDRAIMLAEFAVDSGATQVIAPTHMIEGANDRWLRHDINNAIALKTALHANGSSAQVIYELVLPMDALADKHHRGAMLAAISDVPADAIWLKLDKFGKDATANKTCMYIEAMNEFHQFGVPIIADGVGGMPGLALMAFGAVGGVCHGVTQAEAFDSYRLKNPGQKKSKGGATTRVYVPNLDLSLNRKEAEALFKSSPQAHNRFTCRDTHCCPKGKVDMLANPTKHYLHQKIQEISELSSLPISLRPKKFVEDTVRAVSDNVASAAGLGAISPEMRRKFEKKQKSLGRFRMTMGDFAERHKVASTSILPVPYSERVKKY